MSATYDTLACAEAWESMVEAIKALGPNPPEGEVVEVVIASIWATEGITLDEDHR